MMKCLKASFVRWRTKGEGVSECVTIIIGTFNIRGCGNWRNKNVFATLLEKQIHMSCSYKSSRWGR